MKSLFEYTLEELEKELTELGYSKYSASQIYDWVYRKKVLDFSLMSNIKKELREYLTLTYSLKLPEVEKREKSADSTLKLLLKCEDGAMVECVLMHHDYGTSLCVTSQVGCAMGCAFCASGLLRWQRNL